MKYATSILLAIILLVSMAGIAAGSNGQLFTIPTIQIISVIPDNSVTIETANFPASQTFIVTMGKMGTLGVGGIQVGATFSGSGGTIQETYTIPAELKGQARIAIRLQSDAGFFSYNWFDNVATSASTPSNTATTVPTQSGAAAATATPVAVQPIAGIPTFTITDVVPDEQVTIHTSNFPANQTFRVTMGKMGTLGINGTLVDKTDSGAGGSFDATYSIPEDLVGQPLIAIRLQSDAGAFSYNWFDNRSANTGSAPVATATSSGGTTVTATPTPLTPPVRLTPAPTAFVPTISIVSVTPGEKVTIQTDNFPAGQTFTVTMGKFGTRGIDGISAGSLDSGAGGSIQATFDIPADLANEHQIAIRLQSPAGFFAYNWFWN